MNWSKPRQPWKDVYLLHCSLLTSGIKCSLFSVHVLHLLGPFSIALLILLRFQIRNKHIKTKHFLSWIRTFCKTLIFLCHCYSQQCLKIHIIKLGIKTISMYFLKNIGIKRLVPLCRTWAFYQTSKAHEQRPHSLLHPFWPFYTFFMMKKLNLFINETQWYNVYTMSTHHSRYTHLNYI